MAYCYRPKKDVHGMRYFMVKLKNGKEARASISYKNKLETVKEIDAKIKSIDERLEANEGAVAKKQVAAVTGENVRLVGMRERTELEQRRKVIEDLMYVGESVQFLRYLPPSTE